MLNSTTRNQIKKFLVVGVATLAFDTLVTTTLFSIFNIEAGIASAIGFCSGFIVNFFGNRGVVFKHSDAHRYSIVVQSILYVLLVFINLLVSSWFVHYAVEMGVNIIITKILITILIAVWNFIIFKTIIFSHKTSNS